MEWLKKTKNAYPKCVLEFNFAPISGPYFFIYQKKVKIELPYYIRFPVGPTNTILYKNLSMYRIVCLQ
jgi:hypothetical protein